MIIFALALVTPVVFGIFSDGGGWNKFECGRGIYYNAGTNAWGVNSHGNQIMNIPAGMNWETGCVICAQYAIQEWREANPNAGHKECMYCIKDFTGIFLKRGLDTHRATASWTVQCADPSNEKGCEGPLCEYRAVQEVVGTFGYPGLAVAAALCVALVAAAVTTARRKWAAPAAAESGDQAALLA